MTTTPTPGEGRQEAPRPDDRSVLLERLAERIGVSARTATVFGDPVERDGVTVIPVAKARWGFGGGSGWKAGGESGSGGGGGATVSPVGYIEIRGARARFRPLVTPAALVPLVLAVGAVVLAVAPRMVRA